MSVIINLRKYKLVLAAEPFLLGAIVWYVLVKTFNVSHTSKHNIILLVYIAVPSMSRCRCNTEIMEQRFFLTIIGNLLKVLVFVSHLDVI